ncbi:MAG: aminotransferase class V-fold PLP-dependent enzyme [Candidatus Latescibacterota bacterium]|nr:MAG: aminotransferase class V-fold PLP-dependent enzyme [Candidatus Latescibacterota bacterium]
MEGLIYLDNAATTYPKPQIVYDFMHEFYQKHGVNPGRSGYDMCMATEEVIHATRTMLTRFFNGTDPDRLTFSYNASDSLNMIIQGMLEEGDHVITTNVEHNSVLRPLYHLKHDGIIDVTYLPFDDKGYIDPDDVKREIRQNTKMVVVNHGSNVIGTIQPIGDMGKICRDNGVYFAVDVSQTAGTIPIDMAEMNIDLLAFTGHKCLMGPTGIGGSYVRQDVPIKGTRFGGTGVRSAYPFHLEEFPYRMECGTLNIVGVAGLHAGQKWIAKEGMKNIHQREMKLWDRLRRALQETDGVTTYCADGPEGHIAVLSFNIEGWDAGNVGTMMDVDYNIACRTGLQCAPLVHEQLGTDELHGTVRISIGPFNTDEHIDTAIQAVKDIAARRRE